MLATEHLPLVTACPRKAKRLPHHPIAAFALISSLACTNTYARRLDFSDRPFGGQRPWCQCLTYTPRNALNVVILARRKTLK
jgi:hypothetical protein